MGGFGTWDLAQAHPERFAAIATVCGGGDPEDAARLKDIPVWSFHGGKDDTVPIQMTLDMVNAVRKAGGEAHLTIFPEAGHNSVDAGLCHRCALHVASGPKAGPAGGENTRHAGTLKKLRKRVAHPFQETRRPPQSARIRPPDRMIPRRRPRLPRACSAYSNERLNNRRRPAGQSMSWRPAPIAPFLPGRRMVWSSLGVVGRWKPCIPSSQLDPI